MKNQRFLIVILICGIFLINFNLSSTSVISTLYPKSAIVYTDSHTIRMISPIPTVCGNQPESPSNYPENHSITGDVISLVWELVNCGDVLFDDPVEHVNIYSEFNLTNPDNEIVISFTDFTEAEFPNNHTYIIPNSKKIDGTILSFRFQLHYLFQPFGSSSINDIKIDAYYNLTWIGESESTVSTFNYLPYIIGGVVLFGGIISIYFILRKKPTTEIVYDNSYQSNQNNIESIEVPKYCETINPNTSQPYVYTDNLCRDRYLKKYGILPNQSSISQTKSINLSKKPAIIIEKKSDKLSFEEI